MLQREPWKKREGSKTWEEGGGYLKVPERPDWGVVVVGGRPRDADFIKSEAETPLLISYWLDSCQLLLSLRFLANQAALTSLSNWVVQDALVTVKFRVQRGRFDHVSSWIWKSLKEDAGHLLFRSFCVAHQTMETFPSHYAEISEHRVLCDLLAGVSSLEPI